MIRRYTRPEMGAVWSDETKYARWLAVELAVCEAHARHGVIPAAIAHGGGIFLIAAGLV